MRHAPKLAGELKGTGSSGKSPALHGSKFGPHAGLRCSSCRRKTTAGEKVLALRSSQFKLQQSTQLAKALLGQDGDGGTSCQAGSSQYLPWLAGTAGG